MEKDSNTLTVPNPLKDVEVIRYDLQEVVAAEGRTMEIATLTPQKAPELMAVFNRACFSLGRYYSSLQFQHRLAERLRDKRQAVMIIDEIPAAIKNRGLTQNEATRKAFLDLDPEYDRLDIVEAQMSAALTYVKEKLKAMEGNLMAVKKIYGDSMGVYGRPNPNYNTGGLQEAEEASPEPVQRTSGGPVTFTKARY